MFLLPTESRNTAPGVLCGGLPDVKIRVTVEIDVELPHYWSPEEIQAWYDEGHEMPSLEDFDSLDFEFLSVVDPEPHIEIRDDEQTQQYGKN
jgi:hypothetical protein